MEFCLPRAAGQTISTFDIMDFDTFSKLPYEKRLSMATDIQRMVSEIKAQQFDPLKDYEFGKAFRKKEGV